MLPLTTALTLALAGLVAVSALGPLESTNEQTKQVESRRNVSEDMHLITKSLEDLLGELAIIKREATGRLSKFKGPLQENGNQSEQIRQTKVNRFVLKRVAELESESQTMREEFSKLFRLRPIIKKQLTAESRQEDMDFEQNQEPSTAAAAEAATTASQEPATSKPGMPATTTQAALSEEEASKIGFDVEALKKLGAELDVELEARQQQPANTESLRGVHEQIIKLVDNMVRNYLGNVRRTVQRMTNFIDNQRNRPRNKELQHGDSSLIHSVAATAAESSSFSRAGELILQNVELTSKTMQEFETSWSQLTGRQQSPLIDRIPPRGVELWRDFWDTVRKQVQRINQQFVQLSLDMRRMITGRLPSTGPQTVNVDIQFNPRSSPPSEDQALEQFHQLYEQMSASLKIDSFGTKIAQTQSNSLTVPQQDNVVNNLIDEQDDESTRNELMKNVALRQQIQQEISVFGSIFDIMRAFIQRLRESATNAVRDVMRPNITNNNDNNAVTPGPSVKPEVDRLLGETINSQRNINGQGRPVMLPNVRPAIIKP